MFFTQILYVQQTDSIYALDLVLAQSKPNGLTHILLFNTPKPLFYLGYPVRTFMNTYLFMLVL
ncbi:hypothetical protein MTsN1n28_11840 [Vibrio alginolyticus]